MNHELLKLAMADGAEIPGMLGQDRIEVRPVGELILGSGRIVACDPLVAFESETPFVRAVRPGSYGVEISIAHMPGGDQRIALATIRFSRADVVTGEPALRRGQDARKLKPGEFYGYPVDSGTGGFVDIDALPQLIEKLADFEQNILEAMKPTYVHTRNWALIELNPATRANLFICSSGLGDGLYGSCWGLDEQGSPACLVTDFGVLGPIEDEPRAAAPNWKARLKRWFGFSN